MTPLAEFIESIKEERLLIQRFERCQDKHIWRCSSCKKTKTIRSGFFECSTSLSVSDILQLMLLWVSEVPVTAAAELVGISQPTSVQWYQYFRDICSFKVLDVAAVNRLGGPGHIVKVDESLFFKRKYNVGHNVEKHWIFGAFDTTTKKGYLTRVEDRTANTLVPLIQTWIVPGSTIQSDEWASYNNLSNLGYIHSTVNHTTNFVDPETGTTTNHIESFWCRMKRKLKFVIGSQGDMKWSRLDEAVYREYYEFKNKDLWHNFNMFLGHIYDKYPL
nr:uncharacterized protein LOC124811524 [Hydra vulgaris]